jgi:hypothetical protein
METKEWLAVGALVILALYIGRQSNNYFGAKVVDADEEAEPENGVQAPVVANGQAYYNMHLSLSGTAYNGLSNEFFPLFGFVGARQLT